MSSRIKTLLKRAAPRLAASYSGIKAAYARRHARPLPTVHGFSLAGDPVMATVDFERAETEHILRVLNDVDVVVDVGANVGFYTCLARSRGRHVIAVEPLADNLHYLYLNLKTNGWEDVEVFPVGLASDPGIATLYGGSTGASLLSSWGMNAGAWRRTVALSTLDAVLGARFAGRRLLIKIDVEGTEYDVLRGGNATLAMEPAPAWVVEICFSEHHPSGRNPHFAEVFELFWSHGYEAFAIESGGTRPIAREQVLDWVETGGREYGLVNYAFRKPARR